METDVSCVLPPQLHYERPACHKCPSFNVTTSTNIVMYRHAYMQLFMINLLLFTSSPQSLLSQLAALPLQQQSSLKKLLEARVPQINTLVANAGRLDWISQAQIQQQTDSQFQLQFKQLQSVSVISDHTDRYGYVVTCMYIS